jgi:hypothetical protein
MRDRTHRLVSGEMGAAHQTHAAGVGRGITPKFRSATIRSERPCHIREWRVFQPSGVPKHCATSEDLSVRTPEPGPRAGTNSESGTNRQNGVGRNGRHDTSPSFCNRVLQHGPTPATVLPQPADFCNMRKPLLTGLSAMMQNLPILRQVKAVRAG